MRTAVTTEAEEEVNNKMMGSNYFLGFLYGSISGVAYGFNPFFAKEMIEAGISVDVILFFRYELATLFLWTIAKVLGYSIKINRHQVLPISLLGVFFTFSSLFLFEAYRHIPSGVATTILFLAPVIVAVIMIFYKEYPSWHVWLSIVFSLGGIILFSCGDMEGEVRGKGILLSCASALSYSLYVVGTNRFHSIQKIPFWVLMFYVVFCGGITYFLYMLLKGPFPLNEINLLFHTPSFCIDICGLAVIPTALAMVSFVLATQYIGPTKSAILGVFEPVTAVTIGVIHFRESLTEYILMGFALVGVAIALMSYSSLKKKA